MEKISIQKKNAEELVDEGISSWPLWTKEVSRFPWTYSEKEECYIIEGDIVVETDDGKTHIQAGDFVTFPAGLSCIWDIQSPVKKYYNFP